MSVYSRQRATQQMDEVVDSLMTIKVFNQSKLSSTTRAYGSEETLHTQGDDDEELLSPENRHDIYERFQDQYIEDYPAKKSPENSDQYAIAISIPTD
mmetsp:Transcript_15200/g.20642  ORF Transcript_15200/g.20642 Transcript_15200/m.20642 type:complete len:97 (-) Transcript_15200:15-305(-)